MDSFRLLAERRIDEAVARGKLSNLPGAGKPLRLGRGGLGAGAPDGGVAGRVRARRERMAPALVRGAFLTSFGRGRQARA